MAEKSTVPPWALERLHEIKVTRARNEVTVIVPKDLRVWEIDFLIDAALRRDGLHP